ncbi:AAA family ATPase [Phascolarctobacterium sp.]|uniref:AAA family ATPase n=1 Tax=Phascolarctobacterium sp. TaxID=2049039 RepID=UPI002A862036|nr:AAA family ATPase [Phascolarctobacterium sp.]
MKILRITVNGLPLFKQELDLLFYTQQRVSEDDKEKLYKIEPNYYLHTACAFIGINASGKTSVLKVINLALNILRNEPINHVESRNILGACERATFKICFLDKKNNVYCLKTVITSKKAKAGRYVYSIIEEKLWEKPISSVKSKKYLTDFTAISPIAVRNTEEAYLPDDVSFIIAHNKKANDRLDVFSLLSYTNINILPFTENIPLEFIAFLDPTIEKLYFEKVEDKASIHLKFKDEEELILNNAVELEQYLSSGTIKGIITFSMVKEVLASGGYILVDELENHFNKEIVVTLIRFFMDSSLNKNGSTLIFTTHYPELLDEYDRNDAIYIVRNRNGITAENLSYILKRNDIKKSYAYQSGFLEGTTPAYEAYLRLKKNLAASLK